MDREAHPFLAEEVPLRGLHISSILAVRWVGDDRSYALGCALKHTRARKFLVEQCIQERRSQEATAMRCDRSSEKNPHASINFIKKIEKS